MQKKLIKKFLLNLELMVGLRGSKDEILQVMDDLNQLKLIF